MSASEAWVWLARIGRTQGRKGEVLAEILTDFPEKFAERKRLWLLERVGTAAESAREVALVGHWLHKGAVVLHFAGVESIAEAEALRGLVVAIPRSERAALGEDEVYVGDLIGCELVNQAVKGERVVGRIEDVDRNSGPVALLVVRGADGVEHLVPFARSYLRGIDLDGGRVAMELPAGLLELNEKTGNRQEKSAPEKQADDAR
uniref:16S rRNA processing protein RimM n=1 Tax=mine drainage metagenome TaxID=410659 RepID=E6QHM7_9ZZZZ